jgi:hypothetical protein
MFERGELLLVPFPFSDLSATKRRPVLGFTHRTGSAPALDIPSYEGFSAPPEKGTALAQVPPPRRTTQKPRLGAAHEHRRDAGEDFLVGRMRLEGSTECSLVEKRPESRRHPPAM